jgi:hypothetical protein
MGIAHNLAQTITAIDRQHPIRDEVLVYRRQSMFFTPAEAARLLRSQGLEPQISVEACELDRQTRVLDLQGLGRTFPNGLCVCMLPAAGRKCINE